MTEERKRAVILDFLEVMHREGMTAADFDGFAGTVKWLLQDMPVTGEALSMMDLRKKLEFPW